MNIAYYPDHRLDIEYRHDGSALAWKSVEDNIRLPNGSFTLARWWGCWRRRALIGLREHTPFRVGGI